MLTYQFVRSALHYNADTGVLTWARSHGPVKAGEEAGSITGRGYRRIWLGGRLHMAHRVAVLWMTGQLPPGEVDHIDRNGLNNRWANLRVTTHDKNQRNRKRHRRRGFIGVYEEESGRWRAVLRHQGKLHRVGLFDDARTAALARDRVAAELHGEFAVFNFPAVGS